MTQIFAILLAMFFAFPVHANTDAEKKFREWELTKLQTLASNRDAKERAAAAEYLGGSKAGDVITALGAALSDVDPRVRTAAAAALWKSEKSAEPARAQLLKALDDPLPEVVIQVAGALQSLGMKESELVAVRKRVLAAPDANVSARFLAARGLIGAEPATTVLEPMLRYLEAAAAPRNNSTQRDAAQKNIELAAKALERLAKTGDRGLIAPLMQEAQRARHGYTVLLKTLAVFTPKPERWTSFLLEFLDGRETPVRYAVLGLLGEQKNEADVLLWAPRATVALRDADSSIRSQSLWILGGAGGLAAGEIDGVVAALSDKESAVRRRAAVAIGEMGDRNQAVTAAAKASVAARGRPALMAVMEKDSDTEVRDEARRAMAKLEATGGAATALTTAASKPAGVIATANTGNEASGMAYLRDKKIGFDEGSYFRALMQSDVSTVRAFLDAGMSPSNSVAGVGPPIRAGLFAGSGCAPNERPSNADTKAMVRLLLDRGADPNLADSNGNTALMAATMKGCDRELTKMLVAAGARVGATNAGGQSAFDMGLFFGHDGLEELIGAGYRLPPEKVKGYESAYAAKPNVIALIKKASRK